VREYRDLCAVVSVLAAWNPPPHHVEDEENEQSDDQDRPEGRCQSQLFHAGVSNALLQIEHETAEQQAAHVEEDANHAHGMSFPLGCWVRRLSL
jgi:hypothetical protein